MAKADLTAQRVRELLHYDPETGVFTRRVRLSANAGAGSIKNGYTRISVDGRRYAAHRLAWLYMTGCWPSKVIDHVNGERSDNRWCNLRDVTQGVNRENQLVVRSDNVWSGHTGVTYSKYHRKWKAHIRVDGRLKHLGYFDSKDDALRARAEAKKRFHCAG